MAKKTAVLLDGGFVRKCFSQSAKRRMVVTEVRPLVQSLLDPLAEELFRIYFYDCAPSDVTTTHPISGKLLSLKTTRAYRENTAFQHALARTEQMALRRGELVFRGWRLTLGATLHEVGAAGGGPRGARDPGSHRPRKVVRACGLRQG